MKCNFRRRYNNIIIRIRLNDNTHLREGLCSGNTESSEPLTVVKTDAKQGVLETARYLHEERVCDNKERLPVRPREKYKEKVWRKGGFCKDVNPKDETLEQG